MKRRLSLRFTALLLVLVLVSATLAGCGKSSGSTGGQGAAEGSSSSDEQGDAEGSGSSEGQGNAEGSVSSDGQDAAEPGEEDADGENGEPTAAVPEAQRPAPFASSETKTMAYTPSVEPYEVNPDLSNVSIHPYMYLSDEAKISLANNSFFINAQYGSDEFFEVYEMNRYSKIPNFVTVDSMMHTYHLYFSHLLKNTEINYLSSALVNLSKDMLSRSMEQLNALKGTEWEQAALTNAAFFAVGAKLGDPETALPEEVSAIAEAELAKIENASEITDSLITNGLEDYSQYIVRGYYEGNETLERYFRQMMWFGRSNFEQKTEDLDRSALLMTLAMDGDALTLWEEIYNITSFFAGASDDCTYYEYKPVLEEAYGSNVTVSDLPGNEAAWAAFHEMTAAMPAPKINSIPGIDDGEDVDHNEENKGFRFMGQRFSIDATIFQNLIYSKVGEASDGSKRMLPNALDVPAAFGSDAAAGILEALGETKYPGYSENLALLRNELENAPDTLWNASLYSKWLYTLDPLLDAKSNGYPLFMTKNAWQRKDLQTFLGSYTELKHDTVLYSKQAMSEMGGDIDESLDDRGYVEPEPDVYGRLSDLTASTIEGLKGYGLMNDEDEGNMKLLGELADKLCVISIKELQNETLSDEEYELIRSYGGQLEHFWYEVYKNEDADYITTKNFPAPIVTDIATDPNGQVLEIGTGKASEIYVIVPVDGTLRIASGSVFSFYQFPWPLSDRLTDTKWKQIMGFELSEDNSYNEQQFDTEDWTADFQSRKWVPDY